MFCPAIRRVTAWLCLVVSLWMGLAPAQALVLCLEPDGRVSLEVAVGGRCADCTEARGTREPMPTCGGNDNTSQDEGAGRPAHTGTAAFDAHSGCPCIDIAIPGADNDRVQPRSVPSQVERLVALAPAFDVERSLPPPPFAALPRLWPSDRPSPGLALLRSVVLLV